MELTKLQKAYALTGLMKIMKEANVHPDLTLSESMNVIAIMTKEIATLSTKGDLEEEAIKIYQDAVRKLYDGMVEE